MGVRHHPQCCAYTLLHRAAHAHAFTCSRAHSHPLRSCQAVRPVSSDAGAGKCGEAGSARRRHLSSGSAAMFCRSKSTPPDGAAHGVRACKARTERRAPGGRACACLAARRVSSRCRRNWPQIPSTAVHGCCASALPRPSADSWRPPPHHYPASLQQRRSKPPTNNSCEGAGLTRRRRRRAAAVHSIALRVACFRRRAAAVHALDCAEGGVEARLNIECDARKEIPSRLLAAPAGGGARPGSLGVHAGQGDPVAAGSLRARRAFGVPSGATRGGCATAQAATGRGGCVADGGGKRRGAKTER
jgi:hypothetical protein